MASGTNQRPTPTQVRAARRARRNRRRRFLRYGIFAAVASVSFIFIISLFAGGINFGGSGGFFESAPDGPGERFPEVSRIHVTSEQEDAEYNSVPATSGPHFSQPLAPTRWGVHETELEPEVYVHNFEHGGVAVFYNCPEGCDTLKTQLTQLVNTGVNRGAKMLLAPHSGFDGRIALAAWTFLDIFDEYDEDRIRDFFDSHESSPNSPEPNAR
ncbi:MAG: DUF3105 domain-containing protein [Chloroflexi bacterium]|nr:DUF3105 domain-containing protein [Chloroflexota bacterium]